MNWQLRSTFLFRMWQQPGLALPHWVDLAIGWQMDRNKGRGEADQD